MSGQSAALSIKEAKMMQERIQASGSQAKTSSGGSGKKTSKMCPSCGCSPCTC